MHHRTRLAQLLLVTAVAFATTAHAEENAATPAAPEAAAAAPASEAAPGAAPATEETPVVAATAAKPVEPAIYGAAARWRWVSVPGWFLGLFATKNVPLSTFNCWALEGFWRKHDRDDRNRTWEIVVSVGYQNMTPPDGYWLGRGKDPAKDTDLVQVRGLGLITMDAAYVLRQYFSPYFGIHYGAGLGLGIVRGKVLRASATLNPNGQYTVVRGDGVQMCNANATCNEALLAGTQQNGVPDNGPSDPHRFQENSVPSALPILNLLLGLDFPIPQAKGLEFRLEGGFYDAFFIGLSGGYVFN